jgi:hypothetical protein
MAAKSARSMRSFDPARMAYLEKENWAAYYQKNWGRLLQVSVGMVREGFGLNFWQSLYGAYLVGRAEIAAAPFPDNDIPRAEAYMRRFYALLKRVHHESFDVDQTARLEVNWWVVHRRLFNQPENQPLIDALVDLYAATFGVPRAQVQEAAFRRAEAMLYSDRWVHEGRVPGSPLLDQVEAELAKSYAALLAVISRRQAVGVPVPARL